MKKLNLIFLFTLIYSHSFAQNSLLYEISKPGSKQKSYLFGTMHVQNENAFNFNDSVFWAIDQCKHAAFELDLRENEMLKLATNMKNVIDSNFINQAKLYLKNDLLPKLMKEIPAKTLANKITNEFVPMYSELIKMTKPQDSRNHFVDQLLQLYANKNEKNIVSIETYDEQLSVFMGDFKNMNFDSMQVSEKVIKFLKTEKLEYNLSQIYGNSPDMVGMYQQHNLNQLCDYIQKERSNDKIISKKFYDNIFFKRNQIMFDRTKDMVKNESVFIAVGAGHLCGENGLINQYKMAGYKVRAMNDMKNTKNEIQWQTITNNEYSIEIPKNTTLDTAEFDYFSMYSNNDFKGSLISSRGIATFKIEKTFMFSEGDDAPAISEDTSYNAFMDLYNDSMYLMDSSINYDEVTAAPTWDGELDTTIYPPLSAHNEESDLEKKPKKEKMKDFLTPEQNEYMKEVGDSVKGAIMKALFLNTDFSNLYSNKDSTISIKNKKGEDINLVYKNDYISKSLTYTVSKGDYQYKIIISGDKNLILSEDLRRYFLSFKFKN